MREGFENVMRWTQRKYGIVVHTFMLVMSITQVNIFNADLLSFLFTWVVIGKLPYDMEYCDSLLYDREHCLLQLMWILHRERIFIIILSAPFLHTRKQSIKKDQQES